VSGSAIVLSPEDLLWIEAIAQRAIVKYKQNAIAWRVTYNATIDYNTAYAEALSEVEGFYQKQLNQWGWVEREAEQQLRTKRLEYEEETERVRQFIKQKQDGERQRIEKFNTEWKERNKDNIEREESWLAVRKYNAQQRKRLAIRDVEVEVLQCMIDGHGGRNRWVFQEWLKGRSLDSIAINIGRTRTRVHEIVQREIRRARRPRVSYTPPKGRPLDMGGPRDVWLTYYPSPDPRLDNMEPVT